MQRRRGYEPEKETPVCCLLTHICRMKLNNGFDIANKRYSEGSCGTTEECGTFFFFFFLRKSVVALLYYFLVEILYNLWVTAYYIYLRSSLVFHNSDAFLFTSYNSSSLSLTTSKEKKNNSMTPIQEANQNKINKIKREENGARYVRQV
jgi:hypothetical protein